MSETPDLAELEGLVPSAGVGRRTALATVAARGFSIAATFGLSVVVARVLGVTGAGTFFALFAVTTLLAGVGRWGTDVLALKLVAAGGPYARSSALRLLLIGVVTATLLCAVLLLLLPRVIGLILDPAPPAEAVALAVLSIVPTTVYLIAAGILRGSGHIVAGSLAELGSAPALATVAIAAAASRSQLGLTAVFAAFLGAALVTAVWAFAAAHAAVAPLGRATREPFGRFVRLHAASLSSMCGSATLFYAMTWAPVITLGLVSTSTEVGYLAAAARVAAFVALAPAIQVTYLAPRFAALHHAARVAELTRLARVSATQAFVVGLIPATVILLFPEWCLHIFGSDFAGAAQPLRALTVGALLACAIGQGLTIMVNCGLERTALALTLGSVMISVALMLVVGGPFGAVGVAVVSAAATVGFGIAGAWVLHRRESISPWLMIGGGRAVEA